MPAERDPRTTAMRSIREPGAAPRDPRQEQEPRPAPPPGRHQRPAAAAAPRAARPRPDANPVRLMIGLAGFASAAVFTTAMLPSVTPAPAGDPALEPVAAAAAADPTTAPSGQHVTQYVQLKAGQTAPPDATVVVQPTPKPKVKVVVKTKQSGRP